MSKRIYKAISLIAAAILFLSFTIIIGDSYHHISESQKFHLRNQIDMISKGTESMGVVFLNSLETKEVRIVWIHHNGKVIFDNAEYAENIENYFDRIEVKEALANGYGESNRLSSSLLEMNFSCAKALDDGSIIRLSNMHNSAVYLFLDFGGKMVLLYALIATAIFFIASYFAKKIVSPINNVNLDNIEDTHVYEELRPLMTKLSEQQKQIRKDRAELEKTVLIRQEFTANVSHELKTPLHVISGYAELLKDNMVAEKDRSSFAEKIFNESKRMTLLVDDIIELSSLESRVFDQDSEDVDLYLVCKNAIESIESLADEKDIKINFVGEHAIIKGIPQLLHSIIYNLCDNAIKYNKYGGKVDIYLINDKNIVNMTVKDTGIGIQKENLERIFERFYRVDKSHSKEIGGTGLGLSIIKHACALHSADIKIKSEINKGTTISIYFPKNNFT